MSRLFSFTVVATVFFLFLLSAPLPSQARPGPSLEAAFIRAYNERVEDGTWVQTFGSIGLLAQDYCSGSLSIWEWPYPNEQSDLLTSLQNGVFRCMYNANTLILSTSGQVIINTTLNSAGKPSGAVVDWFDQLAASVGAQYNIKNYQVVWDVSLSESDLILQAVGAGLADAACGRFAPGTSVTSLAVSRDSLYSFMYCPTYLDLPLVWVRKNAATNSWAHLVNNVDTLGWVICVPSTAGGGAEQTCTAILDQTSTTGAKCVGGYGAGAFDLLLTNTGCDAVYGSAPTSTTTRQSLHFFPGPVIDTQGSYFRPTDLVVTTVPKTLINVRV